MKVFKVEWSQTDASWQHPGAISSSFITPRTTQCEYFRTREKAEARKRELESAATTLRNLDVRVGIIAIEVIE